jgi:hypothetical protein
VALRAPEEGSWRDMSGQGQSAELEEQTHRIRGAQEGVERAEQQPAGEWSSPLGPCLPLPASLCLTLQCFPPHQQHDVHPCTRTRPVWR